MSNQCASAAHIPLRLDGCIDGTLTDRPGDSPRSSLANVGEPSTQDSREFLQSARRESVIVRGAAKRPLQAVILCVS
jgi:hypothetical protein